MATEIERKFLLLNDNWKKQATRSTYYQQGYLSSNKNCSIRIRVQNDKASLNIKSATLGIRRSEYDYPLPVDEAREMLNSLCSRPLITKTRYHVPHADHVWEIDEFEDENAGLVVAEIELASEDEPFSRPGWLGEEISHDPRYYNVCLVDHPYKEWD